MPSRGRVALFVTCLVDTLRPRIGFAAARLIASAGFEVVVPAQGCCGQPNFNSGDVAGARRIARRLIAAFSGFEHVVAPSGSCAGMVRCHLPGLFDPETEDRAAAEALARRTEELSQFLSRHGGEMVFAEAGEGTLTYHDSCSGLRELKIKAEPRSLLEAAGCTIAEMKDPESCCGFGGTFCVKYPEISGRIIEEKIAHIKASGAGTVVGGDLGCLLNIEGKLDRMGETIRVRHFAEVLAGMEGETD